MISLVIIDKQEAERNRTQRILSSQVDFEVVGLGKDGYDALKLIGTMKPDIAVLDICLDVMEGTELIPLLQAKSPGTAPLFFTALEDEDHICKALSREVRGYLLKDADLDTLAYAVRLVHGGGRFINPKINDKVYRIFTGLLKNLDISSRPSAFQYKVTQDMPVYNDKVISAGISKIELQIMTRIGQGYTTKEIAENLCLTTGTVRNYLSSAMQKAGLQNRTQIPLFAVRNGLIKLEEKKDKLRHTSL